MLIRLFLAMLAACLSLPAIAASPSDGAPIEHAAQSAATDCHKLPPLQGDHAQKHECIGCIARYDGIACSEPVALPEKQQAAAKLSAQSPQTRAGPDTPPPRN